MRAEAAAAGALSRWRGGHSQWDSYLGAGPGRILIGR